ncbi:hypothetical protein E2C01_037545 [Portunus trituberculatus]|uniref:Uncharacterized protein n=1 Tax=Portunus trituberculatus TaxID=210409 RepID=A0A5B7F8F0_PORTR|nr:hypothetical protein [Portunus trituberculatus]
MSTLANAWKKILFDADVPVVDFKGFESHDFITRFAKAGEKVSEKSLEDWLSIEEAEEASEILTEAETVDCVLSTDNADEEENEDERPKKEVSLAKGRFYCDELLTLITEREKEMPKEAYEHLRIVRRAIIDLQHSSEKQLKIYSFFRPKTPTPPSTPIASPTPSTS